MSPRHPLIELTLSRFREFLREPEAVFWVFAFPVLLACALGLAFRNQGAPDVLVGVLRGGAVPHTAIVSTLEHVKGVRVRVVDRAEADVALRNGAIHLLVVPGAPVTYELDPSRPESRVSRFVVDDVLQTRAGRRAALPVADRLVTVPGSRYIDWVVPGLLGMNIMGTGMWSVAFSVVNSRVRKLLKRLIATPMRRRDYLLSQMASRLIFLVLEVGLLLGFAVPVFGIPVNGSWLLLGGALHARRARVLGARVARGEPRADDRGRVGPDEPGDGAHVGLLRRLLRFREFPGGDAAVHLAAAAHGAQPGAARRDDRRERGAGARAPGGDSHRMDARELHGGAAALPLALIAARLVPRGEERQVS